LVLAGPATNAHLFAGCVGVNEREAGVGSALRAVSLVGHGFGMHQQVQVATHRPDADGSAQQGRADIQQLVANGATMRRTLQCGQHPDQTDERQGHVRVTLQKFSLIPLAKAVFADAGSQFHHCVPRMPMLAQSHLFF
jgi:hypothetical protein